MSQVNLGSIPQALQQTVAGWHGMWYKGHSEIVQKIFETRKSSKYYEEIVSVTGLGLAREKADGSAIQYDDMNQFYTTRFYQKNYAVGYIVTENMIEFNQYAEFAFKSTRDRARALMATTSNNCANVLNRAFNSSYVGGDNKTLCATDHPLGAGGTFRNRPEADADLSEAYLEDALTTVYDYVDEAGIPIEVKAKALVTSSTDMFDACRLMKSQFRVDTANNDISAINEMNAFPMGYIPWVYLSDADATFITTDVPEGLLHFVTKEPEYSSTVDFDTSSIKFKAIMRQQQGWADPRCIFGSQGA